MTEDLKLTGEDIAFIAHETNRAMQALLGDDLPSLPWFWEGRDLRETTIAGVRRVLSGITPEENHDQWCLHKRQQGWAYGAEKDIERRLHPCLVPFPALPKAEQAKVKMFYAVVNALAEYV